MKLRTLQQRMGAELAWQKLKAVQPIERLHSWLSGPVYGMAEIYVPYRMYKVVVDDRGLESVRYIAVDAAVGTLDPYVFADLAGPGEWEDVISRNFHPPVLDEPDTKRIAIEKIRRLLFSRGFFGLTSPRIDAELIENFYVPYWAGFYGNPENLQIKVVDAVRQTMEGNKLQQVIKRWLLESPCDISASVPAGR